MTSTIALRLCGPIQAWGNQSHHEHRDSQNHPTKSGVIGMICNAMNIHHTDDATLAELADTSFTVRVDHEPLIQTDLDYIGGSPLALNKPGAKTLKTRDTLAYRTALHDACFLVLLTYRHRDLTEHIVQALLKPQRLPSLGKAAYMTGPSLYVGTYANTDDPLNDAPFCSYHPQPHRPRIIVETTSDDTYATVTYDNPISYSHTGRRFSARYTREI